MRDRCCHQFSRQILVKMHHHIRESTDRLREDNITNVVLPVQFETSPINYLKPKVESLEEDRQKWPYPHVEVHTDDHSRF